MSLLYRKVSPDTRHVFNVALHQSLSFAACGRGYASSKKYMWIVGHDSDSSAAVTLAPV